MNEDKEGKWEIVHGVLTPGGDPLYICPFCHSNDSMHINGIESPYELDTCPRCGAKLSYKG